MLIFGLFGSLVKHSATPLGPFGSICALIVMGVLEIRGLRTTVLLYMIVSLATPLKESTTTDSLSFVTVLDIQSEISAQHR